MHHKRSKMKPEEELPSPGAVSVQVTIVYILQRYNIILSATCSMRFSLAMQQKVSN